jgi:hypothetical protein
MAARKAGQKAGQKTAAPDIDRDFQPVVAAFAADRDVAGGRMMSAYCLKVNGKIFAMHASGRFVAKLPRARVDALVSAGRGARFDPGHGRLMKEWVAVADGTAEWVALAREAYAFVKRGGS